MIFFKFLKKIFKYGMAISLIAFAVQTYVNVSSVRMLTDDSVNSLKSSLSTFAARGVNLLPSAQPQQLNKQTGNVSSSQTFPSDEVTLTVNR